ncbi:MAG: LysM domain-containing protein [Actinomycetota bacterium]
METPQQSSNARLAAILALIAVFIVLMVVVVTSLGGGGSGKSAAHNGGQSQSTAKAKQSARKIYVVKPGDSLSVIADKVGISVEQLQRLNPHIDQFSLQSGDRVKLR